MNLSTWVTLHKPGSKVSRNAKARNLNNAINHMRAAAKVPFQISVYYSPPSEFIYYLLFSVRKIAGPLIFTGTPTTGQTGERRRDSFEGKKASVELEQAARFIFLFF
jgi:hypothetical protein